MSNTVHFNPYPHVIDIANQKITSYNCTKSKMASKKIDIMTLGGVPVKVSPDEVELLLLYQEQMLIEQMSLEDNQDIPQ